MAVKNYYTVLGVNQKDSADTIKKAYRVLAKKYHPDNNPEDKVAEAKMQEAAEAWEILGNEDKRKEYDGKLFSTDKDQENSQKPAQNKAVHKERPMTHEDFFNMTKNFESTLSPDAIKNSVNQSKASRENPAAMADFFEKVIGFKK